MQCEDNIKLVRNAKISHFHEGPQHPVTLWWALQVKGSSGAVGVGEHPGEAQDEMGVEIHQERQIQIRYLL